MDWTPTPVSVLCSRDESSSRVRVGRSARLHSARLGSLGVGSLVTELLTLTLTSARRAAWSSGGAARLDTARYVAPPLPSPQTARTVPLPPAAARPGPTTFGLRAKRLP